MSCPQAFKCSNCQLPDIIEGKIFYLQNNGSSSVNSQKQKQNKIIYLTETAA